MAAAAAMSAARSMPAVYTVPLGPRIRPPRLLPGTKAENTNPQPDGDVPPGQTWVQGKWRNPRSTAAKDRRLVQSTQVEKALRHATHGMHIYAYRQIRTNQVVYSLSRIMQNNKILDQLLFHGKQTKPAALRRDVWRPYFSIHFPQTKAGAEAGLDTYRVLRELSVKRQLSPPPGSLLATEEDVENAKAKYDPATLADMKENNRPELIKLPRIGQLLPPKYRARKLMDQKESSVADVAFALSLINDAKISPEEGIHRMAKKLVHEHKARSRRNRRRVNEIRRQEEAKEVQIAMRQESIEARPGQMDLDKYAAERIVLEHNGVLRVKGQATGLNNVLNAQEAQASAENLAQSAIERKNSRPRRFNVESFKKEFTEAWNQEHAGSGQTVPFPTTELEKQIQEKVAEDTAAIRKWRDDMQQASKETAPAVKELNEASRRVVVLWSDLRDAMQAEKWSENVQHDWLDAKAIVKKEKTIIRQPSYTDEEGHEIDEQRQTRLFQSSSSPHVMGRDVSEKWFLTPEQLAQEADNSERTQQWKAARRQAIVRNMISCRETVRELESEAAAVGDLGDAVTDTGVDEQLQRELSAERERLSSFNINYPIYAQTLDSLDRYSTLIARSKDLKIQIDTTTVEGAVREGLVSEQQAIMQELRQECDAEFPGFRALEQRRQDVSDSITKSLASNESSFSEQLTTDRTDDEVRLMEAEAEYEIKKTQLVLDHHQRLLQDEGDDSWIEGGNKPPGTTTTTAGGANKKINAQELKDMNVEVDMQELDKRSLWSRVKGIFGR